MYYLQSRYYDPQIGRFINADSYASTGQGFVVYNMFAYCNNDAVSQLDANGEFPTAAIVVGLGVVGRINYAINAVLYEYSDGKSDITSSTYTERKPSREEKIDYVKEQTGDEHYFGNSWRYYSEYSLHEYGWYLTKWADGKNVPILSEAAGHFKEADVLSHEWDIPIVNVFIVLWGIVGF